MDHVDLEKQAELLCQKILNSSLHTYTILEENNRKDK